MLYFYVECTDLIFTYKRKPYHVFFEIDHVSLFDQHFTEEYKVYPHANAFIENFKIDGGPLIDLIDELEDVEPV